VEKHEVKKSVSFKKDPKYHDPIAKMLRFLVGGNPKSNKDLPESSGRKQAANKCAGE